MTFPAELERLLKEATEGPWRLYKHFLDPEPIGIVDVVGRTRDDDVLERVKESDAALICLLVNNADKILGLLRAAEYRVQFGHNRLCNFIIYDGKEPCDCGHIKILEALNSMNSHRSTQ